MASIEFIPDYETDFAKEIFLGLNDRNNDKNAYHFDSKRRMENKWKIDDKVFEFLKKLIEQTNSQQRQRRFTWIARP